MEKLVNAIVGLFSGITSSLLGKEILVFIISMLPLLESRGGILAAALLNMDPVFSYIICMIGNIVVINLLQEIINLPGCTMFFEQRTSRHQVRSWMLVSITVPSQT